MASMMAINEKIPVRKINMGKFQQWLKGNPYLKKEKTLRIK
jgi:hypothetical protein